MVALARGAGEPVAGDGDEVAEDGAGGRLAPGALAVEHQLAGGLGLDEHGVERAADRGQRVGVGIIAGCTRTATAPPSPSPTRSQIASSLTVQPISAARATSVADTAEMPSRCTSAAVTGVWKASEARIAALAAASKPSTSAVGSASA